MMGRRMMETGMMGRGMNDGEENDGRGMLGGE
jgi:hypothetical protein